MLDFAHNAFIWDSLNMPEFNHFGVQTEQNPDIKIYLRFQEI